MLIDRTIDLLAGLAGALLCTLTVLVCLDVASRGLQLFSIPWTLEATEYQLYAITFLSAPWVLRIGGHIAIDLLVQNLPEPKARRLLWIANLLCALTCAVLLYYAIEVLLASYSSGTLVYKSLVFPEWYQYVLPPFTFVLMLSLLVRWLFRPPRVGDQNPAGL